jgi:hypothetical protein
MTSARTEVGLSFYQAGNQSAQDYKPEKAKINSSSDPIIIADGEKGLVNIALFPASDSIYDGNWTSWDYLGLYHRIVWGKLSGYENELWMVLDAKANTAVTLRSWLSKY